MSKSNSNSTAAITTISFFFLWVCRKPTKLAYFLFILYSLKSFCGLIIALLDVLIFVAYFWCAYFLFIFVAYFRCARYVLVHQRSPQGCAWFVCSCFCFDPTDHPTRGVGLGLLGWKTHPQRVFVLCSLNHHQTRKGVGCFVCLVLSNTSPDRGYLIRRVTALKGVCMLQHSPNKGRLFAETQPQQGTFICCYTAPKRVRFSSNFLHKRVCLDLLITAPKWYVLLAYFLHKGWYLFASVHHNTWLGCWLVVFDSHDWLLSFCP